MNSYTRLTLNLLLLSSILLYAEGDLNLQVHLLATQELAVSGEFSQYDFIGVESAFDWTFTTPSGVVYQLQGNAPTANDVFGWKKVTVTPNEASWYMSYLGDWDSDGNSKFDWILVSNGSNAVYKLSGVTDSGNFAYSSKIDVPYTVSNDKTKISFLEIYTCLIYPDEESYNNFTPSCHIVADWDACTTLALEMLELPWTWVGDFKSCDAWDRFD